MEKRTTTNAVLTRAELKETCTPFVKMILRAVLVILSKQAAKTKNQYDDAIVKLLQLFLL